MGWTTVTGTVPSGAPVRETCHGERNLHRAALDPPVCHVESDRMEPTMMRGCRAIVLTLLIGVWLIAPGADASQASPTAEGTPVAPALCTVEPRPIDDFLAIAATPSAAFSPRRARLTEPPSLGGSAPADPTVTAAIAATSEEIVACINTGDFRRIAALMTDENFALFFGGSEPDAVMELATPATPLPPEQQADPLAIEEIRILADRRVAVVSRGSRGQNLTVFAFVDGRYLLDGNYELPAAGTPTP